PRGAGARRRGEGAGPGALPRTLDGRGEVRRRARGRASAGIARAGERAIRWSGGSGATDPRRTAEVTLVIPGPGRFPGARQPIHQTEEEVARPLAIAGISHRWAGAVQILVPARLAEPRGAATADCAVVARPVIRDAGDGRAAAEVERIGGDRPRASERFCDESSHGPDSAAAELLDGALVDDSAGGALHVAGQAIAVDDASAARSALCRLLDAAVFAGAHYGHELIDEDEQDLAHLQLHLPLVDVQDPGGALLRHRGAEG